MFGSLEVSKEVGKRREDLVTCSASILRANIVPELFEVLEEDVFADELLPALQTGEDCVLIVWILFHRAIVVQLFVFRLVVYDFLTGERMALAEWAAHLRSGLSQPHDDARFVKHVLAGEYSKLDTFASTECLKADLALVIASPVFAVDKVKLADLLKNLWVFDIHQ